MEQPTDYKINNNSIYLLKRALYDLKQSACE